MTMLMLRSALAGLACAALVVATPAMAETIAMKASLSPSKEVPPAKSNGTGQVTATYDTVSKKLSWKGTYSGLTGPAMMAHFHGPASPGKNAGMVVPIFT